MVFQSLYYLSLVAGMLAGACGGWMFASIKRELNEKFRSLFDIAAVVMLAQDVLIALFYIRDTQQIILFFVIIFACPACGFMSNQITYTKV